MQNSMKTIKDLLNNLFVTPVRSFQLATKSLENIFYTVLKMAAILN